MNELHSIARQAAAMLWLVLLAIFVSLGVAQYLGLLPGTTVALIVTLGSGPVCAAYGTAFLLSSPRRRRLGFTLSGMGLASTYMLWFFPWFFLTTMIFDQDLAGPFVFGTTLGPSETPLIARRLFDATLNAAPLLLFAAWLGIASRSWIVIVAAVGAALAAGGSIALSIGDEANLTWSIIGWHAATGLGLTMWSGRTLHQHHAHARTDVADPIWG